MKAVPMTLTYQLRSGPSIRLEEELAVSAGKEGVRLPDRGETGKVVV